MVSFVEKGYRVKVKKIVAKFIISMHYQILYAGTKFLYVDLP